MHLLVNCLKQLSCWSFCARIYCIVQYCTCVYTALKGGSEFLTLQYDSDFWGLIYWNNCHCPPPKSPLPFSSNWKILKSMRLDFWPLALLPNYRLKSVLNMWMYLVTAAQHTCARQLADAQICTCTPSNACPHKLTQRTHTASLTYINISNMKVPWLWELIHANMKLEMFVWTHSRLGWLLLSVWCQSASTLKRKLS